MEEKYDITETELRKLADKDSIKLECDNQFIVTVHFTVNGWPMNLLFTPDLSGLWGLSLNFRDRDNLRFLNAFKDTGYEYDEEETDE